MIEFEGWIFDFENMDCLDPHGYTHDLMKLNKCFYVNHKCFYVNHNRNWFSWETSVGTWQYPFESREREELYQRYEQWIVEEIILK